MSQALLVRHLKLLPAETTATYRYKVTAELWRQELSNGWKSSPRSCCSFSSPEKSEASRNKPERKQTRESSSANILNKTEVNWFLQKCLLSSRQRPAGIACPAGHF